MIQHKLIAPYPLLSHLQLPGLGFSCIANVLRIRCIRDYRQAAMPARLCTRARTSARTCFADGNLDVGLSNLDVGACTDAPSFKLFRVLADARATRAGRCAASSRSPSSTSLAAERQRLPTISRRRTPPPRTHAHSRATARRHARMLTSAPVTRACLYARLTSMCTVNRTPMRTPFQHARACSLAG
eukprot:6209454-Pleurochrysis_carterae.AAC.1